MNHGFDMKGLHRLFNSIAVAALLMNGCSTTSTNTSTTNSSQQTGPSFVTGTDSPMASVLSFAVQIESINATDANGKTVSLLSGTPTVDFARLNGLETLLDMNDVPAGTYGNVSITLGAATIGYLQTQTGSAPAIATKPATYPASASTYTFQASLATPIVVAQSGSPAGLHVDFELGKSIGVDTNGNITGAVTPTFNMNGVGINDAGAYLDWFDAAVVSVNANNQSFVVQGPHGRQFTVNVNGQTEWENNEALTDLTTSSIVTLSGALDRDDATIDADDVAILSQNGFYTGGQVTYVTPAIGPAASFDLYVRGLLPTTTGLTLGQIATINLTGNENYFIYWFHNPLTEFVFNQSLLLPGQHVSVGGPATGAANASNVTVKHVVLRDWGFNTSVAANSVSTTDGSFQVTVNGFAGTLIPQAVTVYTAGKTVFRGGLNGVSDLAGGANVRVVGLLLENPLNGKTVLLARYVDEFN